MKKLLFAMIAFTFIAVSCSKEAKLNRKLDGSWEVVTMGGVAMPTGTSLTLEFTKDKDGKGTYTSTYALGSSSDVESGTYTLSEDEILYMLSNVAGSSQDTLTVTSYSKEDLTLTTTEPMAIVLKKK